MRRRRAEDAAAPTWLTTSRPTWLKPSPRTRPRKHPRTRPRKQPAGAAEPAPPIATPHVPTPGRRPVVPSPPADATTTSTESADTEPWGRVDEDGTVSVREADGWRVVGQYPDGTADEALAYYQRKFSDLASEVALLEVRHRRGGASPADLRTTARALHEKLQGAAAVGNLAALDARVLALTGALAAASETEAAASRQAVEEAVQARTELVEKAEALAARDPRVRAVEAGLGRTGVPVRSVAVAAAERSSSAQVDGSAAVEAIP